MSDIQHPEQWTPMEFTCKCGVKCRLDVELIAGPVAGQFYKHCGKDVGDYIPGPIIAAWEERDGVWVSIDPSSNPA
jgi:hypothetical protein